MFSIAAINNTDSIGQWEPLAPTKEAQEVSNSILKEIRASGSISETTCILVYCIFTPLLEEIVYRGFLLTSLASEMKWHQAVAISSAVFSAAHFSRTTFTWLMKNMKDSSSIKTLVSASSWESQDFDPRNRKNPSVMSMAHTNGFISVTGNVIMQSRCLPQETGGTIGTKKQVAVESGLHGLRAASKSKDSSYAKPSASETDTWLLYCCFVTA